MLIAGYYAKRWQALFDAHRRRCRAAVFYVGMLTVHTPALLLATAAERHLYRHSGRYHALLPGSDAGSGGHCHHFILIPPAWAGLLQAHWRALWLKSGTIHGVLDCAGDVRLTLSCLTRIKDV